MQAGELWKKKCGWKSARTSLSRNKTGCTPPPDRVNLPSSADHQSFLSIQPPKGTCTILFHLSCFSPPLYRISQIHHIRFIAAPSLLHYTTNKLPLILSARLPFPRHTYTHTLRLSTPDTSDVLPPPLVRSLSLSLLTHRHRAPPSKPPSAQSTTSFARNIHIDIIPPLAILPPPPHLMNPSS